jgi:hypothetical protein
MTQYYAMDISELWDSASIQDTANIIFSQLNDTDQPRFFIGRMVWEVNSPVRNPMPNLEHFIDLLTQQNIKVILFINSVNDKQPAFLSLSVNATIIFIDYFLWRVYSKVVLEQKCQVSTEWNSQSNQFLFLTGKPNKIQRLRLLYKLSKENLLTSATWSLLLSDNHDDIDRSLIPELNNQEFIAFLEKYKNNPDDIKPDYQSRGELHYGGLPYNHGLYKSALFRVISETYFFSHYNWVPWITEKTWITILNRVPFIMAGDSGTLQRLRDKGFKTFDNYQLISNYDTIRLQEKRLDAIVTNTKHWISNMKDKDQILADVEHNFNQFIKLAKINEQKINSVIDTMGIAQITANDILPVHDDITNF